MDKKITLFIIFTSFFSSVAMQMEPNQAAFKKEIELDVEKAEHTKEVTKQAIEELEKAPHLNYSLSSNSFISIDGVKIAVDSNEDILFNALDKILFIGNERYLLLRYVFYKHTGLLGSYFLYYLQARCFTEMQQWQMLTQEICFNKALTAKITQDKPRLKKFFVGVFILIEKLHKIMVLSGDLYNKNGQAPLTYSFAQNMQSYMQWCINMCFQDKEEPRVFLDLGACFDRMRNFAHAKKIANPSIERKLDCNIALNENH